MTDRPSFENPPLTEVVCGARFDPLTALQAPYLGFWWEKIRKDFPRCHSVPPLAAGGLVIPGNQATLLNVQIGNMPELPRIWFIDANDTTLVQVQQDRFLFNWKRTANHDVPYPRFPKILERFKELYTSFSDFLREHELGTILPLEYELTYVNHLTPGIEIQRLRDLGRALPDISWRNEPPKRFLPEPNSLNFKAAFKMPEGTLTATLATASRQPSGEKFLRFDLNIKGLPDDGDQWQWFESANSSVVNAFIDLTSEELQKTTWKRTQ